MNIDDVRFLLSVLIQTLPTVLSLGLIALFAFPKSRRGNVRNFKTYRLSSLSPRNILNDKSNVEVESFVKLKKYELSE